MNSCKRIFLILSFALSAFSQNSVIPGVAEAPFPTLENISLKWEITGDDNHNGTVVVRYRESGAWIEGGELRRIFAGSNPGGTWGDRFAGSLFNLTPDTEYEIQLSLNDPDGGSMDTTLWVSTRPIPSVPGGAKVIVYPSGNHGEISVESGSENSPVVYRGEPGARFSRINMYNAEWVYLEGLVIEGDSKGIAMNGAKNCVVRACSISTPKGITAYSDGLTNCYIADNVIQGTARWVSSEMGVHGNNSGEGIEFTGAGNVICYNRVSGFRDCISTMEGSAAKNQISNDIHNNYISAGTDDGIEADYLIHNNRIYRNMILNSFVGLSSQPGVGGPNYFFENVLYNIAHSSFKLHNYSVGDVIVHNTVIKSGDGMTIRTDQAPDQAYFRNNLSIGGGPGGEWGGFNGGAGKGANIYTAGSHSDFDYDAVGSMNGNGEGSIAGEPFSVVEENGIFLGNLTSLEGIFRDAVWPEEVENLYDAPDLRPVFDAPVVDKGVAFPGIRENFEGTAPDIGAYEYGQELPHYGPREMGEVTLKSLTPESGSPQSTLGNSIDLSREISGDFRICDMRGRLVYSKRLRNEQIPGISGLLSKGVYFAEIKGVWRQKFLVE